MRGEAGSPQLLRSMSTHHQQKGWMGSPVKPESSHPSPGGEGIDVGGGYQQQQVHSLGLLKPRPDRAGLRVRHPMDGQ